MLGSDTTVNRMWPLLVWNVGRENDDASQETTPSAEAAILSSTTVLGPESVD